MNGHSENNKDKILRATFKKAERLCSKKLIDKLFTEGKSVFVYPVKIVYLETQIQSDYPVQVAFTIPKRNFKKAVQRNHIKRRLREAYRLNKQEFYEELGDNQLAVFVVYTGKTVCEYREIEKAICKGLNKLKIEVTGSKV